MLFAWVIRRYRWCAGCGQKAANTGSELCPTCQAELEGALDDLLRGRR